MIARPTYSKPYALFIILTLFVASFATTLHAKKIDYSADDDGSASRKNDLSANRIQELRTALIGREFVLRLDWREQHLIHDGLAKHRDETYESGKKQAARQGLDFGILQSPAGEVAAFTGMNFLHPFDAHLFARTSRGTPLTLTVRAPLRSKNRMRDLSDDFLTVDWLEHQLSNQAIRFLPKQPTLPSAIQTIQQPTPQGLSLSLPDSHSEPADPSSAPSQFPHYIASLSILAEPASIQRGDSVLLILEYSIEGTDSPNIQALESRTLSKDGETLPGFPIERSFDREIGPKRSLYRQAIPNAAPFGTYTFEGRVCVNGECISRLVTFTVTE